MDTETTGLDITQGHRVIELGAREIIDRQLTDRCFHHYLQPDRDIDWGAQAVHGITSVFLQDKPRFADIAGDFIAFIRDAELIIHNAPFDVGFLDGELKRLGPEWGRMQDYGSIVDTLVMARNRYPGQKNTLDALCKRYHVNNSKRDLHGALLDAEILARIYLVMTGGQISLPLKTLPPRMPDGWISSVNAKGERSPLRVIRATAEEVAAHTARLEAIDKASGGKCMKWG